MVKCPEELPKRTDPSIGGGLHNYVEAARTYHSCKDSNNALIDWVERGMD